MSKRFILLYGMILCLLISHQGMAADVVELNSPQWLGHLKLEKEQLQSIKSAVEDALKSPVDAEQQCGQVTLDCVVRAAREWTVDGQLYREIVIDIHTVGHTSNAIGQIKGKWPAIAAK